MTRKKYEYRKPNDYCSETIYEETRDLGGNKTMGTLIKVVYWDECCQVVKVNWGADIDYEYSRNGEVEMTLIFDEENTKKLILRTGTHNGADMVSAQSRKYPSCHMIVVISKDRLQYAGIDIETAINYYEVP